MLRPGQVGRFDGHVFSYLGARRFSLPNKSGEIATVLVDGAPFHPAISVFPGSEGIGTPAVDSSVREDTYLTLAERRSVAAWAGNDRRRGAAHGDVALGRRDRSLPSAPCWPPSRAGRRRGLRSTDTARQARKPKATLPDPSLRRAREREGFGGGGSAGSPRKTHRRPRSVRERARELSGPSPGQHQDRPLRGGGGRPRPALVLVAVLASRPAATQTASSR